MEPRDYCTERGAECLKAALEQYWRERGFSVIVRVCEAGFHPAVRCIRFDVRSDMVDGLPRRRPAPVDGPEAC